MIQLSDEDARLVLKAFNTLEVQEALSSDEMAVGRRIEIGLKSGAELEDALRKLAVLEAGGVDNWEGYHESLKEYYRENADD